MNPFSDLEGKTAIVTGSSGGIGGAVVKQLCEVGARVIGLDLVPPSTEPPVGARHVTVDLSKPEDVETTWHEAARELDRIDLLVNSAGIHGPVGPLQELMLEQFDHVMSVNLRSVFVTMKLALIGFGDGPGSIVNVGSIASLHGNERLPSYAVSKHGVLGLTRSAARQASTPTVRVNAVCPGPIDTGMLASIAVGVSPENPAAERERREGTNPMHRYGQPDEVARAVVWLLSEQASYVNGAWLVIDGGVMA